MPDSLRPLHAGPAGDRLPLYPLEAAGARGAARACRHALSPRLVSATYVVPLPLWWFLRLAFAMPLLLAAALFYVSPATHPAFTASAHLLADILLPMRAAESLTGLINGHNTLRLAAALYQHHNPDC